MKGLSSLIAAGVFSAVTAGAAYAGQAWMVMRVAWSAGAGVVTQQYPSMEACEKAADHVAQVRTPTDRTTQGIKGAWKFSFNRSGLKRHEPNISMLCVPGDGEIDAVRDGLENKGWYRAL